MPLPMENFKTFLLTLQNLYDPAGISVKTVYWEVMMSYVAECPKISTFSQNKTIEEAISNLKEATELHLEEFPLPIFLSLFYYKY
jgi:predicted RNase H-like HicB family nuclease